MLHQADEFTSERAADLGFHALDLKLDDDFSDKDDDLAHRCAVKMAQGASAQRAASAVAFGAGELDRLKPLRL